MCMHDLNEPQMIEMSQTAAHQFAFRHIHDHIEKYTHAQWKRYNIQIEHIHNVFLFKTLSGYLRVLSWLEMITHLRYLHFE